MERWAGRVAVITGASSGIGAEIAKQLAKAGIKIIAIARRQERLDDLKKEVTSINGKLYPVQCDVTKEEDVLKAFSYIQQYFGSVDILINNAGIARPVSLLEAPTEEYKAVIDTNLMGLIICTREAYKIMKENNVNDAHIININSVAGHYVPKVSSPLLNVYPASKFGVTALTETMRQELMIAGTNIKVTSISPGVVRTEIFESNGLSKEEVEMMMAGPVLESIDVANAVLYVLGTPPHVQVHELMIRPVGEPF